MTATTTTATWKSPSHGHSHSRSSRPSTTPRGYPGAASVGQTMPPPLSSSTRSSHPVKSAKSPDSGYFGFVVNDESIPPDSNPGFHVKQNWNQPSSSRGSTAAASSSKQPSNETNPDFELFRRQTEQQHRFSLSNNVAGIRRQSVQLSPSTIPKRVSDISTSPASRNTPSTKQNFLPHAVSKENDGSNSFFDLPRNASPTPLSPQHNVADHQHARLSLPATELKGQLDALKNKHRSQTVPPVDNAAHMMVSAPDVANLLQTQPDNVLIFDLRVYQQYFASRIKGSLNLCLPTTLLKRPTFTVQKLADTFKSTRDKEAFAKWQDCQYIVVYDANSMQVKEAVMPFNVLKKFSSEGWTGQGMVLKGGFLAFQKQVPQLVDCESVNQVSESSNAPLSVSTPSGSIVPVAGGCSMPEEKSAANPFFGNIRQNMDLLDGVGQMKISIPSDMSKDDEKHLPEWLREASLPSDEGKQVSDKFLKIEKSEQKRMQQALSSQVSYGTPHPEVSKQVQVAGIEKGAKNRYNNIFPFEHTRVKLQGVPSSGCDYVNASHVKSTYSNRRYIATQAPVPATFEDFWRVVWEQDVRVIVMLTAESEGGQVKSHAYWNSGNYGQFKLKKLSEKQMTLNKQTQTEKPLATDKLQRPHLGARRSTQPYTLGEKKVAEDIKSPTSSEPSVATVRHFTLSHSSQPFSPLREVTQIQYAQWPDFGAPANPTSILNLIEQVNKFVRQYNGTSSQPDSAAPEGERPIIVHCSAGCGRTGTFCTVDSVIDMLKKQKLENNTRHQDDMDLDAPDDWVSRDDIDLVAKTVADFRYQRLSLVQNLRQFVLCYESVMQWVVAQEHQGLRNKLMKEGPRRSYQGSLGS